jgi:putative NADH-flavin reductase
MRIAMFGATGTVGSPVLRLAVDRGHHARVLARSAKRVPVADLQLELGDALDPAAVARTVKGCDAAMSMLGGFGDAEAIHTGTANIMAAMRQAGIKRLVIMQGFHIPFPEDPRNAGARFVSLMIRVRSPRLWAASHALGTMLRNSDDLDWTLIRAPLVTPAPATGHAQLGIFRLSPRSRVTTGDLAEAMMTALVDPATIRTAHMIRSR